MRKTNTSVAGCSFNDGTAGLQETLAFSILNDEEGGAVLYRAAWILELCFSKNVAASFFREPLQADQGRFANC